MKYEDIAHKKIQLIQSVWAESRTCTLYWIIVYERDFLPTPTAWISCMYLAQYVHSSSVLRPILYTTYYSKGKI